MITGTGGQDKRIVRNLAPIEDHAAALRIEITRLRQQDARVRLPGKNRTEGKGNVGWRELARGDLIQQGLKQMKIPAIDEGNLCGCSSERFCRI
jgi:hypothetical protein